jgi:hypothetical protein
MSAGTSANDWTGFRFNSDDTFAFYRVGPGGGTTTYLNTTQVFRDPSSWYHIVLQWDTTQATSSNRIKLYINGVQVTAFASSSYPTLNYEDAFMNTAIAHLIGNITAVSQYLDGYLTEVNFIDGQALTPSSFGETSTSTGVWIPKKYSGTYGTNGFYLPFTDNSALTTSSNVGLGKDFSGNANYFATNNISITAGTTYDSMTDVPTLTSATTANYATLNPLMFRLSNTPAATLSNGNLTSTHTPSGYGTYVFSTIAGIGNKFYYEVTITSLVGGGDVGINDGQAQYSLFTGGVTYLNTGNKIVNNTSTAYGSSWTTNDVIGVAFDLINGTITFYKNNVSQGVASSSIGTSAYFAFGQGDTGSVYNWNFGQRPFAYTPPTGFVRLNTFNLTTPTIGATASTLADDYFNTVLYSGNNSTQNITVGFQPDMVWSKCRNVARSHRLSDAVRGSTKDLYPDTTDDEDNNGSITAFISTGFSLDNATGSTYNTSGENYVSWAWKASNTTAVTNTAGSITSTVSANTSAGFSVVTYSANGSTGTVGHGLGVTPSMIIVKKRNVAERWCVFHTATSNAYIYLNETFAADTTNANVRFGNNTVVVQPTSTLFTIGNSNDVNGTSGTYVAYCFAQIAGYSAFGSYTGNGSSDGPFVFTGFRPRFVLVKESSASGNNWVIYDTARDTYNECSKILYPNASNAEFDGSTVNLDILSNGFKPRDNWGGNNNSGNTYIYMAFAESPFKYANAR